MKKRIAEWLPDTILESVFRLQAIKIGFEKFQEKSPILIYQMGKVGSSTVYASLKQSGLLRPIYHIHTLAPEKIEERIRHFRRQKDHIVPQHFFFSKALRKRLDEGKDVRWHLITLVRDPLGTMVSSLFQNLRSYHSHLMDSQGRIKRKEVLSELERLAAEFDETKDYFSTWFDRELNTHFKIDVYATPFDHQAGYQLYRRDNIHLIVLRLEDLSRTFEGAIKDFLQIQTPIPLVPSNVGDQKDYAADYQFVKSNLRIDVPVCEKIYDSKFARHFYPQEMRTKFIEKWSKPLNTKTLDTP